MCCVIYGKPTDDDSVFQRIEEVPWIATQLFMRSSEGVWAARPAWASFLGLYSITSLEGELEGDG